MKSVLFDTNIILDIALKREPHFDLSSKVFKLIDQNQINGYITASTITDIYYISRKAKGKELTLEFLSNLIEIVDIIGIDKNIILAALKTDLNDFEDAIQVSAAIFNEVGIIVTRNKQDFLKSELIDFTPDELLKEF